MSSCHECGCTYLMNGETLTCQFAVIGTCPKCLRRANVERLVDDKVVAKLLRGWPLKLRVEDTDAKG